MIDFLLIGRVRKYYISDLLQLFENSLHTFK